MINILHIVNKLNRGGAEKQIFTIVKGLDNKNYKNIILSLKGKGELDYAFKEAGIRVIYADQKKPLYLNPNTFCKIHRLSHSENINIIHSWLFHPNLIATISKRFVKGIKVVVSKRNTNHWYNWYHFMANRYVYHAADGILVNSKVLMDEIVNYVPVRNKIFLIPNGIDINLINIKNIISNTIAELKERGKFIIGSVGRFAPQKRQIDIIEVARMIIPLCPNIFFILIGDGKTLKQCKEMVKEYNLEEFILFTGLQEDVFPWLVGFDIFLFTSSAEGMPNAVMEAMAMGKPVVAYKVGGISELIQDGNNGFLISPLSLKSIIDSILYIIKNPSLRLQMGEKSKKIIQEFSNEKMLKKIQIMYEKITVKN